MTSAFAHEPLVEHWQSGWSADEQEQGAPAWIRHSPAGRGDAGFPHKKPGTEAVVCSSESVYFLPGAMEISRVRELQELERISGGRQILHRFMVRGHWRRAAPGWTDKRMRWIEPYWKGPTSWR